MIKIDFHGSTHGHFLEYVANIYIMQTTASQTSIFKPPTYSAHAPDQNYLKNRIIKCGHYSETIYPQYKINNDDQVIRIIIDTNSDNMFFVSLTNLMFKAGDVGLKKQLLSIPEHVRKNKIEYRNNWYSKFNERETYINHYTNFIPLTNPVFNFHFELFFSFKDFCTELERLAMFLNQTFFPDASLYNLWSEFISYNQGWQSYIKCNQLLEDMFAGKSTNIHCTVIEEGWINYNLSKICRMYGGQMFEHEEYPTDTEQAYKIIQIHLSTLR
jgi:hypothetical protein